MSQPALSHHLQRLRLAGAITCRREGNNNFYSLAPGPAPGPDPSGDHVMHERG